MATDRRFRFGAQLAFAGSGEEWAAKPRRVEELGRRRDELALSYVIGGGECHQATAPVVAGLAGA